MLHREHVSCSTFEMDQLDQSSAHTKNMETKESRFVCEPLNRPRYPFINLSGVSISRSVSKEIFAKLWKLAEPSTYGERDSDVRIVDSSIRDSREIYDVMFDFKFIQDLTAMIFESLFKISSGQTSSFPSGRDRFGLHFHKCLLYGPNGGFAEHRDKLRYKNMTHTVVVNLESDDPTYYNFTVNGETYELCGSNHMSYHIFDRTVMHSVKMIKGFRVCLVFHVVDHDKSQFPSLIERDGYSNTLEIRED